MNNFFEIFGVMHNPLCTRRIEDAEASYDVVIGLRGSDTRKSFLLTFRDVQLLRDTFHVANVAHLVGKTFESRCNCEKSALNLLLVEARHRRQGEIYIPPNAGQIIGLTAIMLSMMMQPDFSPFDDETVRDIFRMMFFGGGATISREQISELCRHVESLSAGTVRVEVAEPEFRMGCEPPVVYLKLVREKHVQYFALTPTSTPIVFCRTR